MNRPIEFDEACTRAGVVVADREGALLARYLDLLLEKNRQMNLTAIRRPPEAWMRLILESIALVPHLLTAETVLDIGSGGGIPGLPLAIMRPDLAFTLLESTGKKAQFLSESCRSLLLGNCRIVNQRAETAAHDNSHRAQYDIVTARAVGKLNVTLELAIPFLKVGGRFLASKGKRAEEEVLEARVAARRLNAEHTATHEALPGCPGDAVFVEYVKRKATPKSYPRSPGTPKKQPLGEG
jgi:16S rRNA (guanine527-N7)-methyltransferase